MFTFHHDFNQISTLIFGFVLTWIFFFCFAESKVIEGIIKCTGILYVPVLSLPLGLPYFQPISPLSIHVYTGH